MNSINENSSIPPTGIIGEEMQKYISLTRIFLCKVIECIYFNRCPEELSDFAFDDDRWFSLDIPKSPSLRELVSRRTIYGWFDLDIIISDLDVIVERWVLIHEKCENTESSPLFTGKKREIRYHIFRRYSQILRSIYSILNTLPVKTLEFALNQISGSNRRISAVCSHYKSLSVPKDDFDQSAHPDDLFDIVFGPIITPLGKCTIQCTTRKDISIFIPKIINGSLHSNITSSSLSFGIKNRNKFTEKNNQNSQADADGSIWLLSSQETGFDLNFSDSLLKKSFLSELSESRIKDPNAQSSEVTLQSPDEFLEYLSTLSVEFPYEVDEDKTRETFHELKNEVQQLFDDWMQTSG